AGQPETGMLKIRRVAAGNRSPRQLDLRCGEAGDRLVHLSDIPVAIETRPVIKREFMEMGAESALIWDLGGAFHMKPVQACIDAGGARSKRRGLACSARQIEDFA